MVDQAFLSGHVGFGLLKVGDGDGSDGCFDGTWTGQFDLNSFNDLSIISILTSNESILVFSSLD